jgi:cytochrome c oxidase cbb3-type subunit 3
LIPRLTPARSVLVLLAAAALTLGAQTPPPAAAAAPPPKKGFAGAGGDYKQYPPEVLEAGKKYYTANCAFCHGGSAKGGESGPDLLRSVIVLHDENGEAVSAFIHVGRPDKGMPKFNLPEDQAKDIAAFLHDQVRAAAERGTYQILNIVVGNAQAGQAYFNGAGKCSTCHSVTGDLAQIGTNLDPVSLQQKFVMPRQGRTVNPKTAVSVTVTQPSGEVTEGRLLHLDDFSVTLVGKDGNNITYPRQSEDVPKIERHDPLQAHIELLSQYTDSDIHNLTAYLLTIK